MKIVCSSQEKRKKLEFLCSLLIPNSNLEEQYILASFEILQWDEILFIFPYRTSEYPQ